jgi:hypothetical protein
MLTSIELHDDSWMVAGEVDDKVLDRRLPPEVKPKLAQFTETEPELDLLSGHGLAEFARYLIGHATDDTAPHPAR